LKDRGAAFSRLERAGRVAEDTLLVLILGGMVLLAAGQIVLRNFFDIGFIWGDELLRLMVLWIAVAGAVAASRNDKHINVAILDRYLPGRLKAVVRALIQLFTASVCGIVCWQSARFVATTHEFGDVLLGSVPAWILQAVLPIGFGLITWRYLVFTARSLRKAFGRRSDA
jgi:TRAP-type C4-dicarboxylate transport system permease small subunit